MLNSVPLPAPVAGLSPPSLALALRQATAEAHAAVERLPIMVWLTSPAVTRDGYRQYLHALVGLYATLETAFYRDLDATLCAQLGVRPKLPALLRDLAELDLAEGRADDAPRPEKATLPDDAAPRDLSACVGGLYVLEGATLGGRTIARQLRRILGDQLGAARLLDFHGEQTATAWKRFSSALDALAATGTLRPEATIAGALETFGQVHANLARIAPPR